MKIFVAAPFETHLGKKGALKSRYSRYLDEQLEVLEEFGHEPFCGYKERLYSANAQSSGDLSKYTIEHLRTSNGLLAVVDGVLSPYVFDTVGRAISLGKRVIFAVTGEATLPLYHEGFVTVGKANEVHLPIQSDPFKYLH